MARSRAFDETNMTRIQVYHEPEEGEDPEYTAVCQRQCDQLNSGTFYQRQVDALREMGWHGTAEKCKQDLLAQGVEVT